MTTTTIQNTPLSNNKRLVFKFGNDIALQLHGINIIARKEDGYINLNQLCKAGKKEVFHWKENRKTKAFLQVLSSTIGIPMVEIMKYNSGGNGDRHTWGHPQVAINIAQWVSPEFDVKVSKWVFELMTTGSVTLGQEKSNKEIEEVFQKKIDSLQQTVECVANENLQIKTTYSHLDELHDSLRMKRVFNLKISYLL